MSWSAATFAVAGYGLAGLPWQLMVASVVFNVRRTHGSGAAIGKPAWSGP